jgi:hypothetical protein
LTILSRKTAAQKAALAVFGVRAEGSFKDNEIRGVINTYQGFLQDFLALNLLYSVRPSVYLSAFTLEQSLTHVPNP